MIGEAAHQGGANVKAHGGVASGVEFDDSAEVGREAGEAGGSQVASAGHGALVINEARADLAEQSPVLPPPAHLDAEQAFHHRLGALLSRDEVDGAVETEAARQVVVKVEAKSGQVFAARQFR